MICWIAHAPLRCLAPILAAALAACSATVPIESTFPEPLVQPLPYRVGVYYDHRFSDYRHVERKVRGKRWTIIIGPTQTALFDQMFRALFRQAVSLRAPVAAGAERLDGIIQPELEAYRFDTPHQSGFDYFEVWISYRMRLYLPDGTLVASWPFTAYGKGRAEGWQGVQSVRHATIGALRDAAAAVTIEFPQQTAMQQWMLRRSRTVEHTEDRSDGDYRRTGN